MPEKKRRSYETGVSRPDYYTVLGVARDASPTELKAAYRRLAFESHPDRHPGNPAAIEKFRAAAEAYGVLSDANQRSAYDSSGRVEPRPVMYADAAGRASFRLGDLFLQVAERTGHEYTGQGARRKTVSKREIANPSTFSIGRRDGKFYLQRSDASDMYNAHFNSHDEMRIVNGHPIGYSNTGRGWYPIDARTGNRIGFVDWPTHRVSADYIVIFEKSDGVGLYNGGQSIEQYKAYEYRDGLHIPQPSDQEFCVLDPSSLRRFSIQVRGYTANTFTSVSRDPKDRARVIVGFGGQSYYLN